MDICDMLQLPTGEAFTVQRSGKVLESSLCRLTMGTVRTSELGYRMCVQGPLPSHLTAPMLIQLAINK